MAVIDFLCRAVILFLLVRGVYEIWAYNFDAKSHLTSQSSALIKALRRNVNFNFWGLYDVFL